MHVAGEDLARDEAERDDGQVDPLDGRLPEKPGSEVCKINIFQNVRNTSLRKTVISVEIF